MMGSHLSVELQDRDGSARNGRRPHRPSNVEESAHALFEVGTNSGFEGWTWWGLPVRYDRGIVLHGAAAYSCVGFPWVLSVIQVLKNAGFVTTAGRQFRASVYGRPRCAAGRAQSMARRRATR